MLKKLTLLGMAIAAVAVFVAPAVAGAAQVTQSGKALATGTTITGVSTNSETTTELGTLVCSNVTVAGTLNVNSGGNVSATGNSTGNSTSGCSVGTNPLTITSPKFTTLESKSTESLSGHVGLTFVADLFGLECHFESSGASGVFHYTSKGGSITVEPTTLSGPCGGATFHGTFALSAGGKAVELD